MNYCSRIFLNLLLAVSLASTPVAVVLAATDINSMSVVVSTDTDPCHQAADEPTLADNDQETMPCCADECGYSGDGGCHPTPNSPVSAISADSTAYPAINYRDFSAVFQVSQTALNFPPDSPPPIA